MAVTPPAQAQAHRQHAADTVAWQASPHTPLRFQQRTTEVDYVEFVSGTGCSSLVGRQKGRQEVKLASTCTTGNTIHEIGHAIGLWHEQSRSDRDETLSVNWANIEAGREHNFKTYVERGEDGFDHGQHDIGSLMHYDSYAFSSNGKPTLTLLDGTTFTSQRVGLSPGDIAGVRRMYAGIDMDFPGETARSR